MSVYDQRSVYNLFSEFQEEKGRLWDAYQKAFKEIYEESYKDDAAKLKNIGDVSTYEKFAKTSTGIAIIKGSTATTTSGQVIAGLSPKGVDDKLKAKFSPEQTWRGCGLSAYAKIAGDPTGIVADFGAGYDASASTDDWNDLYATVTDKDLQSLINSGFAVGAQYLAAETVGQNLYSDCPWDPCNPDSTIDERCIAFIAEERIHSGLGPLLGKQLATEEILAHATDLGNVLKIAAGHGKQVTEELNQRVRDIYTELLTKGKFANIKFKEQCFLLANIQEFAKVKTEIDTTKGNKTLPTADYNSSLMVQGDPYGLINALTQSPQKAKFFDMETQQISALQPMIRLYKITADENGNESQVEMKFDSHYSKEDVADFTQRKEVRGHGVGLKSFTFSYEGQNPFSVKKSIKAKLVLFANSFSELLRTRKSTMLEPDPNSKEDDAKRSVVYDYTYVDLAMKTGGNKTFSPDIMNPQNRNADINSTSKLNFRLKAILGWANPSVGGSLPSVISNELSSAIYDSAITLNLTPTVHDFGLDEMGRTTLTINYLAYVEDFFDHPNFNIFTDEEVLASQISRRLRYKVLSKNCGDEEQQKELTELKNSEEQAKLIENEKLQNMRAFMNNMLREKKIRFVNVPWEELNKYRQDGPFRKIDKKYLTQLRESIVTVGTEESKGQSGTGTSLNNVSVPEGGDDTSTTDKNRVIIDPFQCVTFFWISDLMDVTLKYIGEALKKVPEKLEEIEDESIKEQLKEEINDYKRFRDNFMKFRLLLGPIELVNANASGQVIGTTMVNLGDLPISAKYFMEFLTERVLKKDREIYKLPRFFNDFFNQFIKDFLNKDTCYGNRAKQKAILSQNSITAYKDDNVREDSITKWCIDAGTTRMMVPDVFERPILNVMSNRDNAGFDGGFENEINYLTYFIARTHPTEAMKGDKLADQAAGIWHYQVGKDKGMVKTIDLTKADAPGLAEVRFEQEGYDGLQQMRVLYDANIKTYLDVNTYPGTYIYVEPLGFDPSATFDLTQFGIGGYYMIIRSAHTLGPGMAESELTARWVSEKNTETATQTTDTVPVDSSAAELQKCELYINSLREDTLSNFEELSYTATSTVTNGLANDGSTGSEHGDSTPPPSTGAGAVKNTYACFIAGTMVTMYDGTAKLIEMITAGDKVLSYRDGKRVPGIVTTPLVYDIGCEFEVAKVGKVVGNPIHPIFYRNEWISLADHPEANIDKMYIDNLYNLEVDGHVIHGSEHNFVIGDRIVSGLGDGKELNSIFCRDVVWKVKGRKTA